MSDKKEIRDKDENLIGTIEDSSYDSYDSNRLKCGCCEEKLKIYYDEEGLEINGVNGSIEDWRKIFLPLLRIEKE
ncbi:hypothetical protein HZA55_09280 [Candidatus Poribacteria bacterium]|nr:hypothetical protein [Candidatus Poribacteria bacterium]